jgi:hypothetical protein
MHFRVPFRGSRSREAGGEMKPWNHPDYEFAPNMFNLSAWSRENEPKGPPRFKVGDRVMFTVPLYVEIVGEDCDGTPLFSVGLENPADLNEEEKRRMSDWVLFSGFSADSFRPVTEEEAKIEV